MKFLHGYPEIHSILNTIDSADANTRRHLFQTLIWKIIILLYYHYNLSPS